MSLLGWPVRASRDHTPCLFTEDIKTKARIFFSTGGKVQGQGSNPAFADQQKQEVVDGRMHQLLLTGGEKPDYEYHVISDGGRLPVLSQHYPHVFQE